MNTLSLALILTLMLVGFVSCSAAIGAEFRGSSGLPKWARSCVLPGRAATTLGRLGRTSMFILMTCVSPFVLFGVLAQSLGGGDWAAALASVVVLAAAAAWMAFLIGWLRSGSSAVSGGSG